MNNTTINNLPMQHSNDPNAVDEVLRELDSPDLMDDDDMADIADSTETMGDTRDSCADGQVDVGGMAEPWLDGLDWELAVSQGDPPPQDIVDQINDIRGRAKGHQAKVGRTNKKLIKILADIYTLAHRHRHDISPILLALRHYKVRVTAATIANPMLPVVRLTMQLDDRRQQSYCARALCKLAAEGVPPEDAARSISEAGGIDACAKAWAKRLRKAKPRTAAEAKHIDADAPTVRLPAETPAPEVDGIYLILAHRSASGAISALGHVVDPRLTARAHHHLIPALAVDVTDLP